MEFICPQSANLPVVREILHKHACYALEKFISYIIMLLSFKLFLMLEITFLALYSWFKAIFLEVHVHVLLITFRLLFLLLRLLLLFFKTMHELSVIFYNLSKILVKVLHSKRMEGKCVKKL